MQLSVSTPNSILTVKGKSSCQICQYFAFLNRKGAAGNAPVFCVLCFVLLSRPDPTLRKSRNLKKNRSTKLPLMKSKKLYRNSGDVGWNSDETW